MRGPTDSPHIKFIFEINFYLNEGGKMDSGEEQDLVVGEKRLLPVPLPLTAEENLYN